MAKKVDDKPKHTESENEKPLVDEPMHAETDSQQVSKRAKSAGRIRGTLKRIFLAPVVFVSMFSPAKIRQNIVQKKVLPCLVYVAVIGTGVALAVPTSRYAILGNLVKRDWQVTVVDSETNKPISEVSVNLGNATVKTDKKGVALFQGIQAGQYSLRIEKPNYATVDERVTVGLRTQEQPKQVAFTATGRQAAVAIRDYITKKPIVDALIAFDGFEVRTNEEGLATIVVPKGIEKAEAKLERDGYHSKSVSFTITDDEEALREENIATLTPTGSIYFLSKQSGKIDVIKSNLDGTDRKTILEGTGFETEATTVLIASRDWQHIAVRAIRNEKGEESISYIRAQDDSVIVADEGDAVFGLVGWYDDTLVYTVDRNVASETNEKYKLKSYNGSKNDITLLDSSRFESYGPGYTGSYYSDDVYDADSIEYATIIEGGVVYAKDYYGNKKDNDKLKIMQVAVDGSNKKQVAELDTTRSYLSYMSAWDPTEAYYLLLKYTDNKTEEITYELTFNGSPEEVKDPVERNAFRNGTYNQYLLSPDSSRSFWRESRDGKAVFLTGGKTGDDPKELVRLDSGYTAYGWLTDKYVLLAKNQSEMYILALDGASEPSKITDYHKPNNGYRPYGYGYGG